MEVKALRAGTRAGTPDDALSIGAAIRDTRAGVSPGVRERLTGSFSRSARRDPFARPSMITQTADPKAWPLGSCGRGS